MTPEDSSTLTAQKAQEEDRLAAVEAEITVLQRRVAALEGELASGADDPPLPLTTDVGLVDQLRARSGPPYEHDGTRGAVTYAGAASFPGTEYVWQVERPVPGLLQLQSEPLAKVIAALGSPQRLQLLRHLVLGEQSSQQLQEALGFSSSGRLYHHLKELLAVGLIEQHRRNNYRLAPRRVVPFLTLLAVALDLSGDTT